MYASKIAFRVSDELIPHLYPPSFYRPGPDCFNGVLAKVANRLREFYAKYDVASRGRRKFVVLGEDAFVVELLYVAVFII